MLTSTMQDEITNIHKSDIRLLLPVESYNVETHRRIYDTFLNVFFTAFDVPEEAVALRKGFDQRDLIDLPQNIESINRYNYYQLNTLNYFYEHIKPINALCSYLFTDKDLVYGDNYEFTEEELKERKMFYDKLRNKYSSGYQYMLRVNSVLFNNGLFNKSELSNIEKRVFNSPH